jgi:hypothetical protein
MRSSLPHIFLSFIALVAVSCAAIPMTVDISRPPAVNPDVGTAVRIVGVTDRRVFKEQYTTGAGYPAKREWIGNTDITDRLVGRVPGSSEVTYYAGVFLAEGDTVSAVVADAVVRGLQRSGYRVLVAGEPGLDAAAALQVFVDSFWVSLDGGPYFEARVVVEGPIPPFIDGVSFESTTWGEKKNFFNPIQSTKSNCRPTLRQGVVDLETDITTRLRQYKKAN